MVEPIDFRFNEQTANSNAFQKNTTEINCGAKAKKEFLNAVNLLKTKGIKVKVFKSKDEHLPDSIFPNNWVCQLPNGPITIFPMLAKNRQKEVNPLIVNWIKEQTNSTHCIDLTGYVSKNWFLEGTGSIIFDHQNKKAFACVSPRTSIRLFEAYCDQIGYVPISFESLDINGKQIYHTNVMMTIAAEYAIVNLDSIENQLERSFLKLELEKSGKKIISISQQQMTNFAANAFEVLNAEGESYLLMSDTAYHSLNSEQLNQINEFSTILRIPIPTIEKVGGGGIRCMVAGLFCD